MRHTTRPFGPHSAPSVDVRLMRPALAAPYAALPGDGRSPLTLAMLTITPPSGCSCMTALARCENTSGAPRLTAMIALEKRGDAGLVSAGGPPPPLVPSTSG